MKKKGFLFGGLFLLILSLFVYSGCARDKDTITIGVILPLTGDTAVYGQSLKNGIELAVEEVNNQGGIHIKEPKGIKTLELMIKDSKGSEEEGVKAINDLIFKNKIKVIIGAATSSVTLAIAPIAQENNTILLSPASSSPEISAAGDYIFRNYPSDMVEGEKMATIAVKNLDAKRICVFAINNKYGQGIKGVFIKKFRSLGGETLKVFNYMPGTMDFKEMVAEAKALNPDTVYLAGYARDLAQLLKEMQAQEFDCIKISTSAFTEEGRKLSQGADEMLIFPRCDIDLTDSRPMVQNFIKQYKLKYSEEPDYNAAYGFDSVKILAHALKRRGDDPGDVQIDLLGLQEFEGVTGIIGFDRQGDVMTYPKIFVIKDGEKIVAEEYFEQQKEETKEKKNKGTR